MVSRPPDGSANPGGDLRPTQPVPPLPRGATKKMQPVEIEIEAEPEDTGPAPTKELKLGGQTFIIKKVLGRGGMAEIFLAVRKGPADFSRKVVVKRILPERSADPMYVQRFIREASTAAKLHHPNVVEILELGNIDRDYYIVMEYVDGPNLHDISKCLFDRQALLPLAIAARVGADVAAALHYAHTFVGDDDVKRRIVHRDVSTSNIMVSYAGIVKLVDFGLAKDIDAQSLTMGDEVLGKPLYMPPEALRGGKPEPSWDVYALGMVLYVVLAGRPPFERKSGSGGMAALIQDVVKTAPFPLRRVNPDVTPAVEDLVMRCLAKQSSGRPESAAEIQALLEQEVAAAGPVTAASLAAFVAELFGREPAGVEGSGSHGLAPLTGSRSQGKMSTDLVAVRVQEAAPSAWPKVLIGVGLILVALVAAFGIWKGRLWELVEPSAEKKPPIGIFDDDSTDQNAGAAEAASATLVVECATWGWVTVDGRRVGTCPLSPTRIRPGKHVIGLEETAGRKTRAITAVAGQEVAVSFVPQPSATPRQPRVVNPTRDSP
jgi:serine/threonine protein kinase